MRSNNSGKRGCGRSCGWCWCWCWWELRAARGRLRLLVRLFARRWPRRRLRGRHVWCGKRHAVRRASVQQGVQTPNTVDGSNIWWLPNPNHTPPLFARLLQFQFSLLSFLLFTADTRPNPHQSKKLRKGKVSTPSWEKQSRNATDGRSHRGARWSLSAAVVRCLETTDTFPPKGTWQKKA